MKNQLYPKGLFALLSYCLFSISVIASPIVWKGEPINPQEQLLSGQLKLQIKNEIVKGQIGSLTALSKIDQNNQFDLDFMPKDKEKRDASTGTFKGYITSEGDLRGHWVRYGMKKMAWTPYASPVRFSKKGKSYVGLVSPLEDELSVFFVGEPKADNSYSFEIFIPETNYGRFYYDSELRFSNERVSWVLPTDDGGEREIDGGDYDPSSGIFHMQLPLWGNGVRFDQQTTDSLGLVAEKRELAYQVPENKNDGWLVGDAGQFGIDSKVLESFGNMLGSEPAKTPHEAQTEAFLVARKGVLVYERYFRGYNSEEPHDLRSASKSLTGILPGLIEQAGLLGGDKQQSLLDTPMYETLGFKTNDSKKQAITLEHALSMSTGLDCNDFQRDSPGGEDRMQAQEEEPNWFRFILKLDAVQNPGSHLAYCSGGINLTGALLTAKTQQWMPRLIEELFARPLGIKQYHINLLPDGQQAYSGGGLRLTARDLLKMGQLMLNKGRWGDKQLLTPEYVDSVLTPRGQIGGKDYGLGWWINTYEVDGRSYRAFEAGGNGGQQIFVIPELDMVAVSLGSAYGTRGSAKMRNDWFPNIILSKAIKIKKE